MSDLYYGILEFKNITMKEQLGIFVEPIISYITSAFGNEMPEHEVDSAMKASRIFIALTPSNKVLAFASLQRHTVGDYIHKTLDYSDETPRLSLGGVSVGRKYQKQGIYSILTQYRLAYVVIENVPVLSATTQNPEIEKGTHKALEFYKNRGLLKEFNLERVLLPGFYKRRLTNFPLPRVAGTPYENLDFTAGDAYSLVINLSHN